MLTGGCLCGQVRYEARGEPLNPAVCHCVTCRRASGGPMVGWVGVRPDDIRITGELRSYQSSPFAVRRFCPTCGTQVLFEDSRTPQEFDVSMGSLDDPESVAPQMHIWVSRQLGWVKLDDGLPRHAQDSST